MTRPAITSDLLKYVADGIRILRTRDGVPISDDQVAERANNIVAALTGLYTITEDEEEVMAIDKKSDHVDEAERRIMRMIPWNSLRSPGETMQQAGIRWFDVCRSEVPYLTPVAYIAAIARIEADVGREKA